MTAALPAGDAVASRQDRAWRGHLLLLGLIAAGILLLFRRDAADMAGIWLESSTFNHCLLIPPIIAWLVWQRLPELRQLSPRPWLPGLAVVGAGGVLWLLGEAGGVALLRHAALIVMLQGAVALSLGSVATRGLAFPLFYALFLVPFGEELVPPMQMLTAHMCMALLGLVGIPAHLEGVFISTPAGLFEVAEACSGVKFLVAMVAYGALVANLCFRSNRRRLLFMVAAVVIPVLTNGIRAWGTIAIASLTSIAFAEGFDHVVYGWIFFAIVIALLMAAGWRFFDRGPGDAWFEPARLQPARPEGTVSASALGAAGLAALLLAASPQIWSDRIAAGGTRPVPQHWSMPVPAGWQQVRIEKPVRWQPHFAGADRLHLARYRNSGGHDVDLAIAVFAGQGEGRELVGFGQGAAGPESGWTWIGNGPPPPGGRLDRIVSSGTVREVATFYRVGGILTGRPVSVKVETMKTRLFGGPQRAVAVLVSAEASAGDSSPRPAIDAFLATLGPVDRLADSAAGGH